MQLLQKKLTKLKKTLLAICLSNVGCALHPIAPPPPITLYGVHGDFGPAGFYGVRWDTRELDFKKFTDPNMKGAQCMSADDAKKYFDWVSSVVGTTEQEK